MSMVTFDVENGSIIYRTMIKRKDDQTKGKIPKNHPKIPKNPKYQKNNPKYLILVFRDNFSVFWGYCTCEDTKLNVFLTFMGNFFEKHFLLICSKC